jgi:hypothetical protein
MIAPWARGVGFGLTFYPKALIYGWLIFGSYDLALRHGSEGWSK